MNKSKVFNFDNIIIDCQIKTAKLQIKRSLNIKKNESLIISILLDLKREKTLIL